MKTLLLTIVLVSCALAQGPKFSSTTGVVALSGAGATFTIQRDPDGNKDITLYRATVYCSVACTITQLQNGTAATATAGTIQAINPASYVAATAKVFTASNVGTGATIGAPFTCTAACTVVFDLSGIMLPRGTANSNYSIRISSITGDYSVGLTHTEK